MKPSTQWWRLCAAGGHRLIVYFRFPQGWSSVPGSTLPFSGVIIGLILEPVPGAVVAMVGMSVIAILSPWLLFSPSSWLSQAFNSLQNPSRRPSASSNSVIWLSSPPLCLAQAMKDPAWTPHCADSGEKMGHHTLFSGYAVMFSELILRTCNTVQLGAWCGICTIIRNLPPLYQSQPNDSSSRSIDSYIMWMGMFPTA
ncbi:anion permease [Shigella flexneri]